VRRARYRHEWGLISRSVDGFRASSGSDRWPASTRTILAHQHPGRGRDASASTLPDYSVGPDRAFDARYDSRSPRHGTGPAVLLEALRCLGPERAQSNRRVHHHGSRVAQALNSAAWGRSRSQNDGLLTNLLTNRSVSRGTEAHISDRSPRSRPGIRRSGLSMAWKRSGVRVP
jgi:hypothetical protein